MNTFILLGSVAFVALSAADLLQTLKLQKLGAVENNPILGKRPAPAKLVAFAVISTALWTWAALWLAARGAPGVPALLALGCFLRLWVVSKGWKLWKELGR